MLPQQQQEGHEVRHVQQPAYQQPPSAAHQQQQEPRHGQLLRLLQSERPSDAIAPESTMRQAPKALPAGLMPGCWLPRPGASSEDAAAGIRSGLALHQLDGMRVTLQRSPVLLLDHATDMLSTSLPAQRGAVPATQPAVEGPSCSRARAWQPRASQLVCVPHMVPSARIFAAAPEMLQTEQVRLGCASIRCRQAN